MPITTRLPPSLLSSRVTKPVTGQLPKITESLDVVQQTCQKAYDTYLVKRHKIYVNNQSIPFEAIYAPTNTDPIEAGKAVIEFIAAKLEPAFVGRHPPSVAKELALRIAFAIVSPDFARIGEDAIQGTLADTGRFVVGEASRSAINIEVSDAAGFVGVHRTSCWHHYGKTAITVDGATLTSYLEMADGAPVLTSDFRVCYAGRQMATADALTAACKVEGWVSWTHTDSPVKELGDELKPKFQHLSLWDRICAAIAAFFEISGIYFLATSKADYEAVLKSRPHELNETAFEAAIARQPTEKRKLDVLGSESRIAYQNSLLPKTVVSEFKVVSGAPVDEVTGRPGIDPLFIPLPGHDDAMPQISGGRQIRHSAAPHLMSSKLAAAVPARMNGSTWNSTKSNFTGNNPFSEPHNVRLTRQGATIKPPAPFSSSGPAVLSTVASNGVSQVTRGPSFTQLYNTVFGADPVRGTPIPRLIHRFWAGGEINPGSFGNLKKMQERVRGTPWKQIIWTSSRVNEAIGAINSDASRELARQLRELRNTGAVIRDVDELNKNPDRNDPSQLWSAFERRINEASQQLTITGKIKRSYDGVKFLSDISRLLITYRYGGVYMDTDIGPGSVDFNVSQLFHRNDNQDATLIPLIGAQVHTVAAFERAKQGENEKTPAENLFFHTIAKQPAFNFFYATAAKTECNRRALNTMVQRKDTSGMDAADTHFAEATENNPQQWVVDWLTDLEWATPASDSVG